MKAPAWLRLFEVVLSIQGLQAWYGEYGTRYLSHGVV
jgi:hypothetical protein